MQATVKANEQIKNLDPILFKEKDNQCAVYEELVGLEGRYPFYCIIHTTKVFINKFLLAFLSDH